MPKETFFRLPHEKQECIVLSAMKEFSRVSYHDASINQIIMNANIPRGSFYMYFKDKKDLYFYLLEHYQQHFEQEFTNASKECHSDLLDTYLSFFKRMVLKLEQDKEKQFFKMVFLNADFKNDTFFQKQHIKEFILTHMYEDMDHDVFNVSSKEEFLEVIDLLHMIFVHNLVTTLRFGIPMKEAVELYERQLSILKNGLYQKKEEKHA